MKRDASADPRAGGRAGADADGGLRPLLGLYAFACLGLFLVAVPWSQLWNWGTLALAPTVLGGVVRSGWFRGAVTGIGLLDLWQAAGFAAEVWRRSRRERNPV